MKRSLSLLSLFMVLLIAACQQQIARTRPPLKPPEQQTEVHALAPNSSPILKAIIDGAVDQSVRRRLRSFLSEARLSEWRCAD